MSVEFRRKPDFPEETHANTVRIDLQGRYANHFTTVLSTSFAIYNLDSKTLDFILMKCWEGTLDHCSMKA